MSATRINFTFWRKIFTIYFTAGTANKHTVKKSSQYINQKWQKSFVFTKAKSMKKINWK